MDNVLELAGKMVNNIELLNHKINKLPPSERMSLGDIQRDVNSALETIKKEIPNVTDSK